MATSVKNKIRLGTLFLFLLLLLSGGLGIFNLVRLKNDAKMILENNYESLDYCHIMQRQLDSFNIDRSDALRNFDDANYRKANAFVSRHRQPFRCMLSLSWSIRVASQGNAWR